MMPRGGRLARCDPCQAAKLTLRELKVGFGEGTQSGAVSFNAT
jgi:hypothetical protein